MKSINQCCQRVQFQQDHNSGRAAAAAAAAVPEAEQAGGAAGTGDAKGSRHAVGVGGVPQIMESRQGVPPGVLVPQV